jgi:hypothetical protein
MRTQATTAYTRSAPTTPLPAGATAASLDEFPTPFSLASLSPPVVTVPRADTDTGMGMGTGSDLDVDLAALASPKTQFKSCVAELVARQNPATIAV